MCTLTQRLPIAARRIHATDVVANRMMDVTAAHDRPPEPHGVVPLELWRRVGNLDKHFEHAGLYRRVRHEGPAVASIHMELPIPGQTNCRVLECWRHRDRWSPELDRREPPLIR